ncbi:MAG TPA: porin [Thermoanaerobaculia bacterium]|nr:porin [Thermoanaerobaculia bacterium]
MRKKRWMRGVARMALAALVMVAAAPRGASAQTEGEYYQELRVDDRIYVFSTEKRFTTYRQSKDMGVSITRLGYGPAGETVIFEDAKAIEAFNRKYSLTEAPPEEVKTPEIRLPFGVQYRMPGLRLSFPKAEINLSNRLQVRYTHESFDDIRNPPSTLPTSLEDKGSFRIRRFKTKFDGWIYTKDLTYELQLNWPDTANPLEDANLDYDFTGGKRLFRLKAGQFKAPFSHQQLTSSGSQQLVDRSILDSAFAPARQIGLQAWGQIGPETVPDFVDWRVGVFNGNGRTVSANDNDDFQYVGRLMVSPWGSVGYSESNLEAYDLRVSFAGEYNSNDTVVQPATGPRTGTDVETFGAAVLLKAFKALFLYGQYFSGESESAAGVEADRDGWLVQGGWLLTPRWEIAGRLAEFDPNTDTDDNDQTEWRGGISWYVNKHNWKIQADYGETKNEAAAATTNRRLKEFRVQAQLIF